MNKIWTIGALLQWTQQYFQQKGIDDTPRLDAEILLAHVMQKERIYLYAHYDEPLEAAELAAFRELVKKRADRLSVAHILGTKSFMGMDFTVNEDVLIPRPETEVLVEKVVACQQSEAEASILDIGTGSGAIILSLLQYLPAATGIGVDVSPKALAIATQNADDFGLSDRVTWLESDLFSQVPEQQFQWIVSNPPYLTQADMDSLQSEVKHDPETALFGGPDGLDFYRRIAADAWTYLVPGGRCALEIGAGQSKDVAGIFAAGGQYELENIFPDYSNIERVMMFHRKE